MDYILDQCRNLVFYIKQNYKNPDLIEEIKLFIVKIYSIIISTKYRDFNPKIDFTDIFNIQQKIFDILKNKSNKKFAKVIEIFIFMIIANVDEFISGFVVHNI